MHLYYEFDEPASIGDVDSLIGHIGIRHGDGLIEEHDIFLDSWFAALVEGLLAAEEGEWGPVDIMEESRPLVFEPADQGLRISFGHDSVTIPSIEEFRKELDRTAREFMDDAYNKVIFREDDPLFVVERFLNPPRFSSSSW